MSEANKPVPGTSLVPTPAPVAGSRRNAALIGAVVVVLIVVLAALGGGLLYYQSRQIAAQQAALATLHRQLTQLAERSALKSQLDAARTASQQNLKTFGDRLDSMDAVLTDLRRRSEAGRDAWIRAEAASLLQAANEEVEINANPALALKALAAADARLKLLSDPRLIPVRQLIAKETTALNAVPQADIEGMALSLSSLAEASDTLPLKRVAPEHYQPGNAPAATQQKPTLWQRIKISVANLGAILFTVRHRKTNIEPLLPPDQEFFLRRNLELRLTAARAALLNRDGAAFKTSAHTAQAWLETYFNGADAGVKAAIEQLRDMQTQDISPALPDISASLTLLRKLEAPRDRVS
ncbi:MAG TPA: uroporphyrinogen-III C-methyltransferase [Gammaproteobacteria bacterium]|nr:uroporphyrinogen-III C-methyltransferase [Gammaproteobacteria bacterium]